MKLDGPECGVGFYDSRFVVFCGIILVLVLEEGRERGIEGLPTDNAGRTAPELYSGSDDINEAHDLRCNLVFKSCITEIRKLADFPHFLYFF